MEQVTFLNNPNYIEYIRLLIGLHKLYLAGKEDSEEADALRDAMDAPWYHLNEQEVARINGISADLYMLSGNEVFRSVPQEQRTREWLGPKLDIAHKAQDWVTVLELLRNGPDFLTQDQFAYLRGQSYEKIGHTDIASMFYVYAASLKPQFPLYSIKAMEALSLLGKKDEALIMQAEYSHSKARRYSLLFGEQKYYFSPLGHYLKKNRIAFSRK